MARCARYDNDRPALDLPKGKGVRVLVFEKINGFKDEPSVNAAHAALEAMAARKGWAIAFTDKGGAFTPATLRRFDTVVWNNISGDVLTLSQRRAMAVVEALEAQGWPAPAFDVGAAGDTGAAAGGINEPLRRRTEVIVEAEPR